MDTDNAEADPADLAAELDEEPPDDLADDTDEPSDDQLYRGRVRGGPWDGLTAESRYPAGFLLADIEHGWGWLYDRQPDGAFVARTEQPFALCSDETVPLNRWRTAEEPTYDILVPDVEQGGGETP